jgi:hypothetical protein
MFSWLTDLWERTTTDPVAFFTFVLSISTIALVVSTIFLWRATRRSTIVAERALTLAERAFIHGGVHPDGRTLVCNDQKIRVRFSMANYGKTPGFIKSVKVGSGKLEELSDSPNYAQDVPVLDLFFPLMSMNEIAISR